MSKGGGFVKQPRAQMLRNQDASVSGVCSLTAWQPQDAQGAPRESRVRTNRISLRRPAFQGLNATSEARGRRLVLLSGSRRNAAFTVVTVILGL